MHLVDPFTLGPQGFAAGAKDAHLGTGSHQLVDGSGSYADHVFAIVQNQQKLLRLHGTGQHGWWNFAPDAGQRHGDSCRNHFWIGKRRKVGEPHTIGEVGEQFSSGLDGQARFPHAAGAGQSHQPMLQY
ncbi:MAG TPA: hypothetical protein VN325_31810 [Steroidobacteraceae bacterium]|nr:hypothetical protein [Steroidobacteraceae bacterium]